jgi:hypothetical protein
VPDSSGSVDLGSLSQEDREALEQIAAQNEPPEGEQEKKEVLTAFIVFFNRDGNPEVSAFEDPNLDVLAFPTPDLVLAAISVLAKDLAATETAHASARETVGLQMGMAQRLQEQQQAESLRANLGNLRG